MKNLIKKVLNTKDRPIRVFAELDVVYKILRHFQTLRLNREITFVYAKTDFTLGYRGAENYFYVAGGESYWTLSELKLNAYAHNVKISNIDTTVELTGDFTDADYDLFRNMGAKLGL